MTKSTLAAPCAFIVAFVVVVVAPDSFRGVDAWLPPSFFLGRSRAQVVQGSAATSSSLAVVRLHQQHSPYNNGNNYYRFDNGGDTTTTTDPYHMDYYSPHDDDAGGRRGESFHNINWQYNTDDSQHHPQQDHPQLWQQQEQHRQQQETPDYLVDSQQQYPPPQGYYYSSEQQQQEYPSSSEQFNNNYDNAQQQQQQNQHDPYSSAFQNSPGKNQWQPSSLAEAEPVFAYDNNNNNNNDNSSYNHQPSSSSTPFFHNNVQLSGKDGQQPLAVVPHMDDINDDEQYNSGANSPSQSWLFQDNAWEDRLFSKMLSPFSTRSMLSPFYSRQTSPWDMMESVMDQFFSSSSPLLLPMPMLQQQQLGDESLASILRREMNDLWRQQGQAQEDGGSSTFQHLVEQAVTCLENDQAAMHMIGGSATFTQQLLESSRQAAGTNDNMWRIFSRSTSTIIINGRQSRKTELGIQLNCRLLPGRDSSSGSNDNNDSNSISMWIAAENGNLQKLLLVDNRTGEQLQVPIVLRATDDGGRTGSDATGGSGNLGNASGDDGVVDAEIVEHHETASTAFRRPAFEGFSNTLI